VGDADEESTAPFGKVPSRLRINRIKPSRLRVSRSGCPIRWGCL